MSRDPLSPTDKLKAYIRDVSVREPAILTRLRAETATLEDAAMQISPEQGQFMALLVETIGAKRCLEIGVFTGYSALVVALALPDDGKLVACDVSEDYTAIARRYWTEAGVANKIDLHIAPAVGTLDRLIADGQAGSFDFAFIDADKPNYDNYYERALTLLRPGGIVAIDNVLWGGSVIKPEKDKDPNTLAIRALNLKIKDDPRVTISLLTLGDGVTVARKRP
jgi:predicted O-methyltransferase YrrM